MLASGVTINSNSIHIDIVVLSGNYTDMTASLLNDQFWLGWVVFVLCTAAFMYAALRCEKRLKAEQNRLVVESGKVSVIKFYYNKLSFIASVLLVSASAGLIYSVIPMNRDGMRGNHDFDFSFS
ncbi:MAG: hypothetical protein ABW130_13395 [Candidatus Thiodiazotropha lotti]